MYEDEEAVHEKVDELMPFQEGDVIVESPDFAVEVIDTWEEQVSDAEVDEHVALVSDGEEFQNKWYTTSVKYSLYPSKDGNYALIRDDQLVLEGRTAEGETFGEGHLD